MTLSERVKYLCAYVSNLTIGLSFDVNARRTYSKMGGCASSSSTVKKDPIAPERRYRVSDKLGEGAFGVVYLAEDTSPNQRRMVAIKYIKRTDVDRYVERELRHLCRMRHPHIVRVHEVYILTSPHLHSLWAIGRETA